MNEILAELMINRHEYCANMRLDYGVEIITKDDKKYIAHGNIGWYT